MTRFLRPSASSSALRFIDRALCTPGSYSLSYLDQEHRWVIRKHLHSLINEFPTFSAVSDHVTIEGGTKARLLCVFGDLRLSGSGGAVEIKITLYQSYPFVPPLVSLSSSSSSSPSEIDWSNPLVDASTKTVSTPYLKTWKYWDSNLLDLVRNLRKIFKLRPPFVLPMASPSTPPLSRWAFWVSKREAIDRLYVSLSQDLAIFRDMTGKEIESLQVIREQLKVRSWVIKTTEEELGREKKRLFEEAEELEGRVDEVSAWVEDNHLVSLAMAEVQPEDCFFPIDQKSTVLLDNEAENLAIDDVVDALDKALQEKVIKIEDYVKNVRTLFRKQFPHVHCVHHV